jgi:hypothetical protein
MEDWATIEEFPNYLVSSHGRVRNEHLNREVAITVNQRGVAQVGLGYGDNRFTRRGVAKLVATAHLEPSTIRNCRAVINIDGNRLNNHVANLAWRPHWFAQKYHAQFKDQPYKNRINTTIENIKTGEQFPDSWSACLRYGLLEHELVMSIFNRTYSWPTFHEFRII